MKLYGGGGTRVKGRPKKETNGLSKKKKIVLIVIAVILALIMGAAAYVAVNIKAPSAKQPTVKPPAASSSLPGDEPELPLNDLGDRADKKYTFLVCATDKDEAHTDNIMLVSFDTATHQVNVLNIPRDTMSNCGRKGASKKINAAYMSGGIEATMRDVTRIIGFEPDFYLTLSFQGIADMVDAIGGITYNVPFRMYYTDPWQNLKIDFQPGEQEMDGEEVVEFLRWRKNNSAYRKYQPKEYDGSDSSRIQKQQEFLTYVAKEVLNSANVGNAMSLAQAVFNNIETDLSWGEMLWLVKEAFYVDFSSGLNMMTLPGYAAYSYAGTGTPYSFYFPSHSKTLEIVNTYFNPYNNPITNIDVISKAPEPYDPSAETEETEEPESEVEYMVDENGELLLDENGDPIPVVPEEPEYMVDENGEPILDENGDPIPVIPAEGEDDPDAEDTEDVPSAPDAEEEDDEPSSDPADEPDEPTVPDEPEEPNESNEPAEPAVSVPVAPAPSDDVVIEIPAA